MEQIARRSFCGTALLALPLLRLQAQERDIDARTESSDPVMDALADAFTRTTVDGAQNGFRGEHFRQYAEMVRIFDAHMEAKGSNRELNKRLNEEDHAKMDPARIARTTVEYWKRHGIIFNENELIEQLSMDGTTYRNIKQAIKKQGGVRSLHRGIVRALEQTASNYAPTAYRRGPVLHKGHVVFAASPDSSRQAQFVNAQWSLPVMAGPSEWDCYCRAMAIEGAILMIICLTGICPPCCVSGGFILALEKLLEGMNVCVPSNCHL